ncbi:MAG: hypothetical protein AAGF53_08180 [Pseudomonadota bacterium]
MPQIRDTKVTPQDMVRSRSWRIGYESFRKGEKPEFDGHRSKCLSYEYGRLTAAWMRSEGQQLLQVPTTRPIYDAYVPHLADALMHAAHAGAVDAT